MRTNQGGVLGQIVSERRQAYAEHSHDLGPARPRQRRFQQALSQRTVQGGPLALIAEVKCASPSKGHIATLDPAAAALAYQRGGAAAISVLTEPRHFGGSPQALQQVVQHLQPLGCPVLRKDFVVHPAMLQEAAQWGASAVLLMVSVLGEQTAAYIEMAHHVGLDALVEVHDEAELHCALQGGAEIIGVNNRDLVSLRIDLGTSPRLIQQARQAGFGGLLVAESGYTSPQDLASIAHLADAVLVGSHLAASGDLERATRQLLQG